MDGMQMDLVLSDGLWQPIGPREDVFAELARLRRTVDELRRENFELRQQAGFFKACHAKALERVAKLEKQNVAATRCPKPTSRRMRRWC